MFAMRTLRVRSWAGTNLLGGGDGATLADPRRQRRARSPARQRVLEATARPPRRGHQLHIDYVADLGDWKTAWDHITFAGFLGTRMTHAVHLAGLRLRARRAARLDLARLADLALRRGEAGPLPALGFFFKDPRRARQHRCSAAATASPVRDGVVRTLVVTTLRDLAELVRAPAALSVPGDALAGAASAGWPAGAPHGARSPAGRRVVCLYWAGMALNDWADRDLDAVERPERPIPSGRVSAAHRARARRRAHRGGRRHRRPWPVDGAPLAVATVLAAAVWAYDLLPQAGPAAAPPRWPRTRGLDVLLGASAGGVPALGPGRCPRRPPSPPTPRRSRRSAAGRCTAALPQPPAGPSASRCVVAGGVRVARRCPRGHRPARAAGLGRGAGRRRRGRGRTPSSVGGRQAGRGARPRDAATARRATVAGIRGLVPLQSASSRRGEAGPPSRSAGAAWAARSATRKGCRRHEPAALRLRPQRLHRPPARRRARRARRPRLRRASRSPSTMPTSTRFAPELARGSPRAAALLREHGLDVVVETGGRYVLDPRRKHHPTFVCDDGRERRIDLLRQRAPDRAPTSGARGGLVLERHRAARGHAEQGRAARRGGSRACSLPVAQAAGVTSASSPSPGCSSSGSRDVAGLRRAARRGPSARAHRRRRAPALHGGRRPADVRAAPPGDLVVNVQIDDMRRGVHEHLPFGEGEVDFPPVLAALSDDRLRGLVAVELPRHSHAAPVLAAPASAFLRDAAARRPTGYTEEVPVSMRRSRRRAASAVAADADAGSSAVPRQPAPRTRGREGLDGQDGAGQALLDGRARRRPARSPGSRRRCTSTGDSAEKQAVLAALPDLDATDRRPGDAVGDDSSRSCETRCAPTTPASSPPPSGRTPPRTSTTPPGARRCSRRSSWASTSRRRRPRGPRRRRAAPHGSRLRRRASRRRARGARRRLADRCPPTSPPPPSGSSR